MNSCKETTLDLVIQVMEQKANTSALKFPIV